MTEKKISTEQLQQNMAHLQSQGAGPNDLIRYAKTQGYDIDLKTNNQLQPNGILTQAKEAIQKGVQAGMTGPFNLTKRFADYTAKNPEDVFEKGQAAFPIVGALAAGPAAPIGAALGETARQAVGTAIGSKSVPTSPGGIFANVALQGAMASPELAIPKGFKNVASKLGKMGARTVKAFTGLPENDVAQGFKQGYETYLAPSTEKAQEIFRSAMSKEGLTGKVPIKQVFDPSGQRAKKLAIDAAQKLESGIALTAEEALNARQATDRIIAGTPVRDKVGLGRLFEYRKKFDDALASVSGPLKNASESYRQAMVKSKFLEPLRLTKQGYPSAVSPMLSLVKSGGTAALPMIGTSPLLIGAGVTTAGQAAKMGSAIAQVPAARQMSVNLAQLLMQRRLEREKK